MDSLISRTKDRLAKALTSLEAVLVLEELPEHVERDAALLRFELVAELIPKLLQRMVSEKGAEVSLPKDVIRTAHSASIVEEQEATLFLSVIDDRNRMVHDYSEEFANELFTRVKREYAPAFRTFVNRLPE
jgi:nucleotidyltransferase substrate binding protein (TIGR01987 family)